jgi:cbb3-type cytochrome oxidase maturation protein
MSALGFLVPIALGLGLLFAFLFLWSLRGGQWEELDDVARRVVEDDDAPAGPQDPR